ncbi:hypothetical protein E3N88_38743 [Mikania micrantha]|uniref:Uncharacterized protein n=1 Tax=Mikania micrantha TaxID=192012 RepID=A0A5N6LUU6_9ASTR|nr:hypothetical protein E3N88_38743 [Mikania micrantha]
MIDSPRSYSSKVLEEDDVIEWHLVIYIRGSKPLLGVICCLHQSSMNLVQVGDCKGSSSDVTCVRVADSPALPRRDDISDHLRDNLCHVDREESGDLVDFFIVTARRTLGISITSRRHSMKRKPQAGQ